MASAEPPPEVRKIRLVNGPFLCFAPLYLAEALLRIEGFSEIEYVPVEYTLPATLAKSADISLFGGPSILPAIDSGLPLVVIAGLHAGCWELFGNERVNSIRDLKGKRVAVSDMGGVEHVWISRFLPMLESIHALLSTGYLPESSLNLNASFWQEKLMRS